MTVERTKAIIGGLDLGTDPAKTALVTVADSVRFVINGIATSRLGRKRVVLEFPEESIPTADTSYVAAPFYMQASTRTRGVGVFYDQRLFDIPPEVLSEPNFILGSASTKWAVADDFSWYVDENNLNVARYLHSGGSGTLTQTVANMAGAGANLKPNTTYTLEYTITFRQTGGATLGMTGPTTLSLSTLLGRHQYTFTTGASPGDLVLTAAQTSGTPAFDIGDISIKEPELNTTLPQRLNFVYKQADKVWLNRRSYGDASGIITADTVRGGTFLDLDTRAQITTRKDEVYITDSSTRPKIMRRLPVDESTFLSRVKYNVGPCGIEWPLSDKDRPRAGFSPGGDSLQPGVYRFRVAIENRYGDISNPSLVSREVIAVTGNEALVLFPAVPSTLQLGWVPTKWRVYVSYQAGYVDGTSFRVTAQEPTAFVYWKSFDISEVSCTFKGNDAQFMAEYPLMPNARGAMPKLSAFKIINGTGYGIAADDLVRREVVETDGDGTPLLPSIAPEFWNLFPATSRGFGTRLDQTTIKQQRFSNQYFIVSAPAEPQYMSYWIKFASGDEYGVAIEEIGDAPVIFTNLGIIVFDPVTRSMKRTVSEVGTLSRDSVSRSERGIRFMGSDGVPRLFNGATVEELAEEVLPIFAKEDYAGWYKRLDREFIEECSASGGGRKWFLSFPVNANPGNVPDKPGLNPSPQNHLLLGDATHGRAQYSIDTAQSYEQMLYLGKSSRHVGIDFGGTFFYIEESLVDEQVSGNTRPIHSTFAPRLFGGAGTSKFTVVNAIVDTKGQPMTLHCQVDDDPDLQHSFTLTSTQRQEFRFKLPGNFRGISLLTRFSWDVSTMGRPEIYDVNVEVLPLGVF